MTEMKVFIKRNSKIFFKDKGVFFTSLITPLILLVLYATFLAKVYKESFVSNIPSGVLLSDAVIDGFVGAQLFSSLLAVCTVTVAFCSNMLMVSDKLSGATADFGVSPMKQSRLAIGYYLATLGSTLTVCLTAAAISFVYIAAKGWFMSVLDVVLVLFDIFILVMFGTALSSLVNFFLTSQGQISAVGTIVSSSYGFLCGAYMPISSFGEGLRRVLSFLPGTYGMSLIRNHSMRGVFKEMEREGFPSEAVDSLKDAFDCNIYFFDSKVSIPGMYAILIGATLAVLAVYVLLCRYKKPKIK